MMGLEGKNLRSAGKIVKSNIIVLQDPTQKR